MFQIMGTYTLRNTILRKHMFKEFDLVVKNDGKLKTDLKTMNEGFDIKNTVLDSSTEILYSIEKEHKEAHRSMEKLGAGKRRM